MCVSVELENDLFRNTTSVCLCGCLSTFTSYKKNRQKKRQLEKKGDEHICILLAPTSSGSLVMIQAGVIRGARRDTCSMYNH